MLRKSLHELVYGGELFMAAFEHRELAIAVDVGVQYIGFVATKILGGREIVANMTTTPYDNVLSYYRLMSAEHMEELARLCDIGLHHVDTFNNASTDTKSEIVAGRVQQFLTSGYRESPAFLDRAAFVFELQEGDEAAFVCAIATLVTTYILSMYI
jgi:hypothetical protein